MQDRGVFFEAEEELNSTVFPTVASDPELGQVRRRKYTPLWSRSIDPITTFCAHHDHPLAIAQHTWLAV